MSKVTAKKRIIIAAALFGVFIIGALISIVLVLAAQTQNVTTSISISYVVDGVGADVGFRYAMIPTDTATDQTITPISQVINEFGVSEAEREQDLGGIAEGTLAFSSESRQIVFEYYFKNTAESAFSIRLTKSPYLESKESGALNPTINMEEKYYVSAEPLSEEQWGEKLINEGKSTENFAPQALTEEGSDIYIYVSANVENPNKGANYEGEFIWELNQQDTINIKLNERGVERTYAIISDSVVANIAMPPVVPETSINEMFMGYNTAADGSGITYINRDGTTPEGITADLEQNAILYAQIIDAFVVDESGVLTNLTAEGQSEEVLYIPEGITAIGDGTNAVSTTATKVLVPSSVTEIAANAFSGNTTIEYVDIEEKEQTKSYAEESGFKFKEQAFSGCTNLKGIVIPSTITEIASNAFSGCSSLTEINLKSLEAWLSLDFGEWGESYPFWDLFWGDYNCLLNGKPINDLIVPNTITEILPLAFAGWKNLESVSFEDETKVESIGNLAFGYCRNLKSIEIPKSLKVVGVDMFDSCSLMSKLYIEDLESYLKLDFSNYGGENNSSHPFQCSYENKEIYINGKLTTEITIPEGITALNEDIFYNCTNIISISIRDSITSIGDNAFYNCSSLEEITIPSSVTSIGYSAFLGCSNLNSITFAEGSQLTSIGDWAFNGCSNLTGITIQSGVTSIGNWTFSNCSRLTSITIPSSVTSIGSYAFSGCSGLISITIPNSVESIGNYVFYNCSSLTSIIIPESVTSIGNYAFQNCSNLTSVTFENTSGWFVTTSSTATSGTNVTLSSTDFAANATLLKTTHCSKYWKHKA